MRKVFETDILELLDRLQEEAIYIWHEHGKLKYKCKQGLSNDLLNELKDLKEEVIEFLQYCEENKFPMSPLQSAYLLGSQPDCELGNTNAHYYIEYEAEVIDVEKLTVIINELIKSHDVLRMIILKEGKNLILRHLPKYEISVYAYTDRLAREKVRNQWKNNTYKIGQWPMFHFEVGKSKNANDVLHISFDCLILDAWSAKKLIDEIFQLYQNQTITFPKFSFRAYMEQAVHYESKIEKQAQTYFQHELKKVLIPKLKTRIPIKEVINPRFERVEYTFSLEETEKLYEKAKQYRLTPAATLCTLFIKVLCHQFEMHGMTLDITLFNRLPLNAEIDAVIGEFTNVGLITFEPIDHHSFLEEVKEVQRQFWKLVQYREYDGTKLIKQLGKGKMGKALLPVVYTCMLGGINNNDQPIFQEVYALSKTPQVMLDHHVRDDLGSLKISFDYVTDLFLKKDMENLMEKYVKNIKTIMIEQQWECCKLSN